jgi:two-component system, LytTR family, response regulator
MISAIILDDEELARQITRKYLEAFPQIEIVAECADGFEGIKAIQQHKPQLLFLDIKMPKLDGFEVLELIDSKPEVIFTTAHDEFAIKAFERNAIDYLMKPFSRDRFAVALGKAITRIETEVKTPAKLEETREQINTENLNRIVIRNGSNIKIIPIESVLYIEAQDDYVMIYTSEGKFLKQQTMKYYETCLDPKYFIRIHRSYIIKIEQIKQIEPYEKDSFIVKTLTGAKLSVSKAGYKKLKEVLNF